MRKIQVTFFTILLMGFISCDNGQTFGVVTKGAEGEPCYEDGSCDKGMICKSDICVKEEDIGNSGKDDGENSYIDENNSDSDTSDDLKYCGDNIINDDEVCDGGTKNCTSISSEYTGGTANCRNDCSGWDVSTCEGTAAPFCGDNIINNNEICDGGTKACVSISQDYSSGTAICKSDCSGWNVSNCKYCGNGSVDSGEICDGGTKSCTSISSDYVSGTANCRNDCSGWDVSKCDGTVAPFCGDNIVNNGEICDGGTKACVSISQDYSSGTAICKSDCSGWNVSNCKYCGNGSVDSGEICDGGTKSCTSISSDYVSGTANCRNDCSGWDVSKCDGTVAPFCGDNIVNNGEICDGGNKNCTLISSEYKSGTATCKTDCSGWDVTGCSKNCPTSNKFCNSYAGKNWSDRSSSAMDWNSSLSYCTNLGGRLPTISELRTIIQYCPVTQPTGSCGVKDSCVSYSSCWSSICEGCSFDGSNPGKYSVFGDKGVLWSSSERSDSQGLMAWAVTFYYGSVGGHSKTYETNIRCVK